MMVVTQLSLKRMESLQNGLKPHSGATPFVSIDFNGELYQWRHRSVESALTLTLGVKRPLMSQTDVLGSFVW